MRIIQGQKLLIEIDNDDEYEEPTIFEKIDHKKQSIHAIRQLQKYMESLETKKVVLHRKTYHSAFDAEQMDKLFLIYIGLEYNQKEFDDLFFANDIQQLSLTIKEPDNNQESTFVCSIDQFLTPEEMQVELETNGLKDMKHLQLMAKQILENRIQPIMLPEDAEYQEGMSNYTFQIVLDGNKDQYNESPENYNKLDKGENQQSTIIEAASVDEDVDK